MANASVDAIYAYDADYEDEVDATMRQQPLVMAEENCTLLYGNVSAAVTVHNVTCLGHAPTLSQQVRGLKG